MPYVARTPLRPLALAAALSLLFAPPVASQRPLELPASDPADTIVARDSAPAPDTTAVARDDGAEALLGNWRCVRRGTDGGPPGELEMEIRAEGRWADRSGPRAIVARYEWDAGSRTVRLLSAGGAPLHTLRLQKKKLVGDGVSCERAK